MSRRHLTKKQHHFLEYLRGYVQEEKVWPTYRDLVDHFGYRSPNSVTQNLQALSKKGFLRRDRDGYHLVEPPEGGAGVPVRQALQGGSLIPTEGPKPVTLRSLLRTDEEVHALRIDAQTSRDSELADAHLVFLADATEAIDGEQVVTLSDGHVGLTRVPLSAPASTGDVLGLYVGHAGPFGVVLPDAGSHGHPASMPTVEAGALGSVAAQA